MTVFKNADVAYHPNIGKCAVKNILSAASDGKNYYVENNNGEVAWASEKELSFEPWPKPVHKRKFKPVLKTGDKVAYSYRGNPCGFFKVNVETEKDIQSTTGGIYLKSRYEFFLVTETPLFKGVSK